MGSAFPQPPPLCWHCGRRGGGTESERSAAATGAKRGAGKNAGPGPDALRKIRGPQREDEMGKRRLDRHRRQWFMGQNGEVRVSA